MAIPDENFKSLLADYAMDTTDNGFTQATLEAIMAQKQSRALKRKWSLYGAMFTGGIIAGSQISSFGRILQAETLQFELSGGTPYVSLSIIGLIIFGMGLWLVEQREISI